MNKYHAQSPQAALATGNAIYQCRYCDGWHTTGAAIKFAAQLRKRSKRAAHFHFLLSTFCF